MSNLWTNLSLSLAVGKQMHLQGLEALGMANNAASVLFQMHIWNQQGTKNPGKRGETNWNETCEMNWEGNLVGNELNASVNQSFVTNLALVPSAEIALLWLLFGIPHC